MGNSSSQSQSQSVRSEPEFNSAPIDFSVYADDDSCTVTIDEDSRLRNHLIYFDFEIYECPEFDKSPICFSIYWKVGKGYKGGLSSNKTYEIHGKSRNNTSSKFTKTTKTRFATRHPSFLPQMSEAEIYAINNQISAIKNYKLPNNIKSSRVEQIKIVCLGRPGAGKSSFYNTVHGIMKNEYKDYSPAGNSYGSFTKKILMGPLENSEITIIDTPGFSSLNNYSYDYWSTNLAICLKPLLEGYIKAGYEHFNKIDINAGYYNGSPTVGDEIHAVAVFYDINNIVSNSDSGMMKQLFEELVETNKYKPLVILTHCDKYYKEQMDLRHEPSLEEVQSNILENATQKFITQKAKGLISRDDIKFMINYTCDFLKKPRDAYKEQYTLDIIRILEKRGELRISNRLREI